MIFFHDPKSMAHGEKKAVIYSWEKFQLDKRYVCVIEISQIIEKGTLNDNGIFSLLFLGG